MKTHNYYCTEVILRIKSRSIPNANGCIEYQPTKHKYGLISITIDGERKSIPAHRALYMAVYDKFDLPGHIQIRHKCDNPRCVNQNHLVEGTSKDNMQDCIERGRRATKHKLHTRQCRLTNEQILDIRNGNEKPNYYCCKYNITNGYVSKIRNRKAKTLV